MTLRETHRTMQAWTDLIASVQAEATLAAFIDPLLDLNLQAARLLHVVNLPRRGQHGGRR